MKHSCLKKCICLFLALLVTASSLSVVSFGADFSYPKGVTESEALSAVKPTDKLISAAVTSFTDKSLKNTVVPMIYGDSALSGLLVSVYQSLNENAGQMETVGIDLSVSSVAAGLSAYPAVQKALLGASDWQSVKLDGVSWGKSVKTRAGFAKAAAACFNPLNDALYMLLCSGSIKVSLITVKGGNGYENSIVPILSSLGCTGFMSQADFSAAASENKSTMIENILLPVLSLLEKCLDAPATGLTGILPGFAYFEESGQLNACIEKLLAPITENKIIALASMLGLIKFDALNIDIEETLNSMLSGMAAEQGLTVDKIDFAELAACGTVSGNSFTPNQGRAYVVILRWILGVVSKNSSKMGSLMGTGSEALSSDMLENILGKEPDALISLLISLFNAKELPAAAAYTYASVEKGSVTYTETLSEKNLKKVLSGMDELLDEFAKEYSDYDTVSELLSSSIYTNENINKLTIALYSYLEKQGLDSALKLLGIDISPKGVASLLKEDGYSAARARLGKTKTWSKASLSGVTWNFYNGRRVGFENALNAVLRPLYPLLRVVLAGEDLTVLNSIKITGADGYNSSVIPLLEALGCKSGSIKSYKNYIKYADTDAVLGYITEPVFDLLDTLMEKPVNTLCKILPNLVYTLDGDFLTVCIDNLLRPVTSLTSSLSGVYEMNLDTKSLTKELNLNTLLSGVTKDAGINLPEIDAGVLKTLGTAKTLKSKQVQNGKKVSYTYIEADSTAVLLTVLRTLVNTLKLPENKDLLSGLTSSGADAGMFASYSSSIFGQFDEMNTDQTIEWLYNLLFSERATAEVSGDAAYIPNIHYTEQKKNYTVAIIAGVLIGVAAVTLTAIWLNKEKLFYEQKKPND